MGALETLAAFDFGGRRSCLFYGAIGFPYATLTRIGRARLKMENDRKVMMLRKLVTTPPLLFVDTKILCPCCGIRETPKANSSVATGHAQALSEAQRRCRPGGSAGARSPTRTRSPGKGRGRGAAAESGKGFVPYRNSVLTRLLKESLGGNSRTVSWQAHPASEDHRTQMAVEHWNCTG